MRRSRFGPSCLHGDIGGRDCFGLRDGWHRLPQRDGFAAGVQGFSKLKKER